jgi:hypothetical protein
MKELISEIRAIALGNNLFLCLVIHDRFRYTYLVYLSYLVVSLSRNAVDVKKKICGTKAQKLTSQKT